MSADFWERYDEDYGKAEPLSSNTVPDGEYEVIVTHCAPGESKKKGTPQIQWGFTINGGPQNGRKLFKDQNITPQGMSFVRGDFETVFPRDWKFSQCMNSLGLLVNARLKVKVHTKKGEQYPNVYINERLDKDRVADWIAPEAQPIHREAVNAGSGASYAPAPAVQPALPGVPAAATPFD